MSKTCAGLPKRGGSPAWARYHEGEARACVLSANMGAMSMRYLSILFLAVVLGGCASLTKEFDPPKVSLENFQSLPSQGGGPRFRIDLEIQNPNAEALDIAGISYDIEVQGKDLISGVSNEVPRIEGYSAEKVTLEAGLNMIELIRFLTSIGTSHQEMHSLEYTFKAKIDFRGLIPTQRIEESGVIGAPR